MALGTSFAARQWRRDQKWRRQTAITELINNFEKTPGARNAMMMLTWPKREVPLWDHSRPEERYTIVEWLELERALIPDDIFSQEYTPKISAIRDSFEDFFGRLARIELYIQSGLISKAEAHHLVAGWVERLDRLTANPQLLRNLKLYIDWRQLRGVQQLFGRFGVDLKSTAEDRRALRDELAHRG